MSNPGEADSTPITSVRQLADYFAAGCKSPERFRIGTEHEKFGFRWSDLMPPPYEDGAGQGTVRAMIENLAQEGGVPILDRGNPIGLRLGSASIALEPAGQLELSGAPLETLHETQAELAAHLRQVSRVGETLGLGFAPLGFHPTLSRAAMPWMPKSRYAIMRRYMPLVGSLGLDMMTRTCTVQVNLDYASEQDLKRKLRVSLALQPVVTALFANSPFTEGKPNGYLSYRAQVWTDTDNDRSGLPEVMFQDEFGFERYAEWLVDRVPMYFVYRDGQYIDVAGSSFRDFISGRVPALQRVQATVGDFADHVTTVFTDVRVKRFLEMRGADAGTPEMMLALPAFWVGLLYDSAALESAVTLTRDIGWHEACELRSAVPRLGLATPWRGGSVRDLARDAVAIAADGLRARGHREAEGRDERIFLQPLHEVLAGNPTQAEHWLSRFEGAWQRDVRPIFREAAI